MHARPHLVGTARGLDKLGLHSRKLRSPSYRETVDLDGPYTLRFE